MDQNDIIIKAEDLPIEEKIARIFLAVAGLTPEQFGMVKLYLAIIRRLEQDDAHASAITPLVAESIAAGIAERIKPIAAIQSGDTPKRSKSPDPANVAPTAAPAPRRGITYDIAPEVARFAEYLVAHDISQKRAAADIGYKSSFISRVINGRDNASEKLRQTMTAYVDARRSPGAPLKANPTPAAAND